MMLKDNPLLKSKAGEAGIIPPGFIGTFEVVEAVKKYYVVVES
jgi:Predicted enzyme of the cupin superfamily